MKDRPRFSDRIWDAVSLSLVLGGVGLFAYARHVLTQIGDGGYPMPKGVSAVAQTDLFVAQSRVGVLLLGAGVTLGVIAALRHALRPRA